MGHDQRTFVIVGGGLAGARAAETLRDKGFRGRLVVFAAEPHFPYERPPLSKTYLSGDDTLEQLYARPPHWYVDNDVELLLASPATGLDLDAHTVSSGSDTIGFDKLLVATGSSPRRLPLADDSGAPVAYLRTIEDSRRLRERLRPECRLVVVGGGWIGLEVAAAARTSGSAVTVVEPLQQPLLRVLGPELATVFAELHTGHGVDLRTGASVVGIDGDGNRAQVYLDDGAVLPADLVLIAIGALPDTELAETAGVKTDDGIVVDQHLQTSARDVFAAGDVANAYHPHLGHHLRVEHWDNAVGQGTTAALNMLGADISYSRMPYFYTDQYDLGMEYVGHVGPDGYDDVVIRGDLHRRVFSAFWLRDSTVLAGMHVNDWDSMAAIRRIVAAPRVDVTTLTDPRVPLDSLASGTPGEG